MAKQNIKAEQGTGNYAGSPFSTPHLQQLWVLYQTKGRLSKVIETLTVDGPPDPVKSPEEALLYGWVLGDQGDYELAAAVLESLFPRSEPGFDSILALVRGDVLLHRGQLAAALKGVDRLLSAGPPTLISAHLYNLRARVLSRQSKYPEALRAIASGISAAQQAGDIDINLVLEGNRGAILSNQGELAQAIMSLERTVRHLVARDGVNRAAHYLIVLSEPLLALGQRDAAHKCLIRAERLAEQAGSFRRRIYLKQQTGAFWGRAGEHSKEWKAYQEALDLLQQHPDPLVELDIVFNQALATYGKGNMGQALRMLDENLAAAHRQGNRRHEIKTAGYRGRVLISTGSVEEGIKQLLGAVRATKQQGTWFHYVPFTMFLSLGYCLLHKTEPSARWARECIAAAEQHRLEALLVKHRDDAETVLRTLSGRLQVTGFLARVMVNLQSPLLLKSLLKDRPPQGKLLFLRALECHDAPAHRNRLTSLTTDRDPVVRRVAKQTVSNWLHHTVYRVHTLGSFRLYREELMLPDQVWVRAGVKRLFLYLVTNHGKWVPCDALMEALWKDPDPVRTRKMLANQFSDLRRIMEPWSLPGWDYHMLLSQRDAYGLFPGGRIWIDADEFLESVRAGDAALLKRGFREARKSYREALELYIGEYLEEQPYDDWVAGRREYMANAYFRAVLSYARLERDSGNPAEARRALEEALFKDPSRSECMALLQELLLSMGLSKEAQEWATRHRKIFA